MITIAIVRNILVRVGADIRGYQNSMRRAGGDVNRFSSTTRASLGVAKVAFAAFAVAAVAAIGAVSTMGVKSAMEFESSMQQVNRIMGENSAEFLRWGNTQASAFNMSRLEAVKYGSVYGNLISGISSSQKETMDLTTQLLKSSAVVASATGREMTDVMERIRSGLLGNTESIEDLGINVNVAMLESTKAFQKFANGKSWDQLSFQTQQQIRLFAILEQSAVKYGTEINQNTSSGVARLTSMLKDAQLNLGQAFLPVVNIVLPILTSFAQSLKNVTATFSQFMQALFGINKEEEGGAKSAADAAAAQLALGDATKKAGAAAKKGVAGFDEINSLQEEMAANAEDAANAARGVTAPPVVPPKEDKFEIPQAVLDLANKTREAFRPIGEYLLEIGRIVKKFWADIQPALQPVIDYVQQIFKPVWEGLSKIVAIAFNAIKEVIRSGLQIIQGVVEIFSGILTGNWEMMWQGVKDIAFGFWNLIKSGLTGFLNVFQTLWSTATGVLKVVWETTWNAIKNFASDIWNGIKSLATTVWASISNFFSALWDGIKTKSSAIWEGIKTTISSVWEGLKTQASTVFNAIKNTIVAAFTTVGDIVKGIWDGIKTSIKDSINFIISTINSFISKINSIKISIPEVNIPLIGKVGGGTIGFPQIPEIPMLARGGEIAKPTLAMMGERNRKEVVLPLQDSSVWDMMASTVGTAVLNAMQFSQPQQGSQTQGQAVFNLDGTQFARAVIPLISKEQARQGTMAIQGV